VDSQILRIQVQNMIMDFWQNVRNLNPNIGLHRVGWGTKWSNSQNLFPKFGSRPHSIKIVFRSLLFKANSVIVQPMVSLFHLYVLCQKGCPNSSTQQDAKVLTLNRNYTNA
jgi:hypothetical protein